jgi:hypothetical protein
MPAGKTDGFLPRPLALCGRLLSPPFYPLNGWQARPQPPRLPFDRGERDVQPHRRKARRTGAGCRQALAGSSFDNADHEPNKG